MIQRWLQRWNIAQQYSARNVLPGTSSRRTVGPSDRAWRDFLRPRDTWHMGHWDTPSAQNVAMATGPLGYQLDDASPITTKFSLSQFSGGESPLKRNHTFLSQNVLRHIEPTDKKTRRVRVRIVIYQGVPFHKSFSQHKNLIRWKWKPKVSAEKWVGLGNQPLRELGPGHSAPTPGQIGHCQPLNRGLNQPPVWGMEIQRHYVQWHFFRWVGHQLPMWKVGQIVHGHNFRLVVEPSWWQC